MPDEKESRLATAVSTASETDRGTGETLHKGLGDPLKFTPLLHLTGQETEAKKVKVPQLNLQEGYLVEGHLACFQFLPPAHSDPCPVPPAGSPPGARSVATSADSAHRSTGT